MVVLLLALACEPIDNDSGTSPDDTDVTGDTDGDTDVADTDTDVQDTDGGDTDTDVDTDTGGGDTGGGWTPWGGLVGASTGIGLLGERALDGTGWRVAGGDVDGDGSADAVVAAIAADPGGSSSGKVYVVPGPIPSTVHLADVAALDGTAANLQAGTDLDVVGDTNGDSYDDVLVTALQDGSSGPGYAYLALGPVTGETSLSAAAGRWTGAGSNDRLGYSATGAGDLDGDGYADFAVGEPYYAKSPYAGVVYVFHGPVSGSDLGDAVDVWSDADVQAPGLALGRGGDLDGDGYDDLLVGVDHGGVGECWVESGPLASSVAVTDGDAMLHLAGGSARWQPQPETCRGAGDTNGDGYADVVMGNPTENVDSSGTMNAAGAVYVEEGPLSGTKDLFFASARYTGMAGGDSLGLAVTPAGDIDADGHDDLLLSAPYVSAYATSGGAVYLVPGDASGTSAVRDAAMAVIYGEDASQYAWAAAGDVDWTGDGWPDVMVGVLQGDGDEPRAGAAFLFSGDGG